VLLVDERRLPVEGAIAPAALLTGLIGRRVLTASERRAIVRRLAATREDVALPPQVRTSPSFAGRVVDALDRDAIPAALEPLANHVRTLTAFAELLDVRAGLHHALANGAGIAGDVLSVDAQLLADADDAFAWRRLAALAGVPCEAVDLGPPRAPALALDAVAGFCALLRFADRQRDADARDALRAPQSSVSPDDAQALLAAAGERAGLLEVIAKGASPEATRFAQGLARVGNAYRVPDASAASVLAAMLSAFPIAEAATRAALERVAADFDEARRFAPLWQADDLLAEIEAELGAAPRRDGRPAGVAVAPLVADEPAEPVPIRKLSFSASSLNAYAECARKWWFRYACAAVEDRGSSASFYGIAFHAALEDFHHVHARFDAADAPALGSFLDGCVSAAFDRYRTRFDAPVEFELQKRRARRTAKKYLSWLLERARRAPFEVIGCEESIDIELDGHRFVGYIDRLDRDDRSGTVTVVDYKTGSIATSAQEYLDAVRSFHEFQLPFYYWARTIAGDVVSKLALIPLKDALLDVVPVELEVVTTSRPPRANGTYGEVSVAELERARAQMIALADDLSRGVRTAFPATQDADACRYCAYANACRERPRVLEERFGR
jgi:RecB family exonuclease